MRQRPIYTDHALTAGPYVAGDTPESHLGVILLAHSRGFCVGWWSEGEWIEGSTFPLLSNVMRNLSFDDLKAEAQSAAGILTEDCCDGQHYFGYDSDADAWGVWSANAQPVTPA